MQTLSVSIVAISSSCSTWSPTSARLVSSAYAKCECRLTLRKLLQCAFADRLGHCRHFDHRIRCHTLVPYSAERKTIRTITAAKVQWKFDGFVAGEFKAILCQSQLGEIPGRAYLGRVLCCSQAPAGFERLDNVLEPT